MSDKRYPRGKIHTKGKATPVIGEMIELKSEGVFYCDNGKDNTIFVPYSNIARIEYHEVPEELLKAAQDARPDTTETNK